MPNFLQKLQHAPEPVKQSVLIGTSLIAGVLVVAFWLNFMTGVLQAPVPAESGEQPTGEGFSFGQTLAAGVREIGRTITDGARGVIGAFQKPRDYSVTPTQ